MTWTCDHYCLSGHLLASHESTDSDACISLDAAELQGNLRCGECDWEGDGWNRLLHGIVKGLLH